MKNIWLYTLGLIFLVACSTKATKQVEVETIDTVKNTIAAIETLPDTAYNYIEEGDEQTSHYICTKKCKGSGDKKPGSCTVCGSPYLHNDSSKFHSTSHNTFYIGRDSLDSTRVR